MLSKAEKRAVHTVAYSILTLAKHVLDDEPMCDGLTMRGNMTPAQYARFLAHMLFVLVDGGVDAMNKAGDCDDIALWIQADNRIRRSQDANH